MPTNEIHRQSIARSLGLETKNPLTKKYYGVLNHQIVRLPKYTLFHHENVLRSILFTLPLIS